MGECEHAWEVWFVHHEGCTFVGTQVVSEGMQFYKQE
jgi:hypothetical protein